MINKVDGRYDEIEADRILNKELIVCISKALKEYEFNDFWSFDMNYNYIGDVNMYGYEKVKSKNRRNKTNYKMKRYCVETHIIDDDFYSLIKPELSGEITDDKIKIEIMLCVNNNIDCYDRITYRDLKMKLRELKLLRIV